MMPGGRAIKMPQDGMVSAEMTDAYRGALAKAIEQALVVLKLVDINFLYLLHFKSNGVVRSETLQDIFYRLKQTLQ